MCFWKSSMQQKFDVLKIKMKITWKSVCIVEKLSKLQRPHCNESLISRELKNISKGLWKTRRHKSFTWSKVFLKPQVVTVWSIAMWSLDRFFRGDNLSESSNILSEISNDCRKFWLSSQIFHPRFQSFFLQWIIVTQWNEFF